ncbi:MAG: tRNA (adenosine(37)-N6)-dimethylallyltransferase MiaA [Bacilli bacterium]|nr:tRNA (adenosine(37)-N6)-dimethylallyltransferase MiaA [Bacilli bacterium]
MMNKIIVIVGPTGVGKTKLSIELAKKLNGEIINADSTQVFKDLDIATAKATLEEQENIPHHLIDIKETTEDYTVYDFQYDARNKIDEILSHNKTPIMVGGTGLYIKASLYNYEFEEENHKFNYDDYSNEELYEKLLKIDPQTKIHKNNRKRVERALSYYEIHHEVMDNNKGNELLYDAIFIGLTIDRTVLYDRINKRVDVMVKNGLLEEAQKIYESKIRTKAVMTPIGYKELFDYFENKSSLAECLELIKQRSRKYAKRQYTWFNNQMNVKWFNVEIDNFTSTVNEILEYIEKI